MSYVLYGNLCLCSDIPQSCQQIHRAYSYPSDGGGKPAHRYTLYPNYNGFFNQDSMYATYAFEHDIDQVTEPVYVLSNPLLVNEPIYGFRDNYRNLNVSDWSNPFDIAFYVPRFTIVNQTTEYKLVYLSSTTVYDSLFCNETEFVNISPRGYQCQILLPFFQSAEVCSNYSSTSYTFSKTLWSKFIFNTSTNFKRFSHRTFHL